MRVVKTRPLTLPEAIATKTALEIRLSLLSLFPEDSFTQQERFDIAASKSALAKVKARLLELGDPEALADELAESVVSVEKAIVRGGRSSS